MGLFTNCARPRSRALVPLGLAAAAALLAVPAPAHADPDSVPACVAPDAKAFPLTTRIHGGPGTYVAGGGYATWYLDLTNTTDRACTGIHPVVVLVDEKRALTPAQPRLEFFDVPGDASREGQPHPVRFEATDRDELVGAFDDGFPGFTVAPDETLTVKVRLALTSDAVPNRVTAAAAVVQRRADDGDWVGQSNEYRFTIDSDTGASPGRSTGPEETEADSGTETGTGADTSASPGTGTDTGTSREPAATASPGRGDTTFPGRPEELAATGFPPVARAAFAVTALVLAGAALIVLRRRP
ncbi:hypothetical protein [Streptomyces sp. MN13]